MEIIDLTEKNAQGNFGHDQIDALTGPGNYRIPIRAYKDSNGEYHKNIAVEVVSVFYDHGTQFIVVPDDMHDYYYIFYYNGNEKCFKPNWDANEDYNKILNWINIEIYTDSDGNIIED